MMELENLPPDILEKMKACGTAEELLALAEEEGFELPPEQLDKIFGGSGRPAGEYEYRACPRCGYRRAYYVIDADSGRGAYRCPRCGHGLPPRPFTSREL